MMLCMPAVDFVRSYDRKLTAVPFVSGTFSGIASTRILDWRGGTVRLCTQGGGAPIPNGETASSEDSREMCALALHRWRKELSVDPGRKYYLKG